MRERRLSPLSPRTRRGVVSATVLTAAASVAFVAAGGPGSPASSEVRASPDRVHPEPAVLAPPTQPGRRISRRPNVLLVTIDDAAHQDFRYMPYTRNLVARRGVTMTNFVAPTPICVPSRASTLTGEYAHNHHLVTVGGPRGEASYFRSSGENRETVATWLDRAGYDTFMTGKWMNGYEKDLPASAAEPGWDRWEPTTVGTYDFFSTQFFDEGQEVDESGRHNTYAITDRATGWIRSKGRDRDPWFAWVNYVAPHTGTGDEDPAFAGRTTVPAPEDRGDFEDLDLRRQPNMFRTARGSMTEDRPLSEADRPAFRYAFQQRVEALQAVDRGVRDQITALRRTGQLRHTYVIVTSDNGYAVGEHKFGGKLLPYRDSLMVPMAIRGPGVPRGRTVETVAAVPDLAVTIAAIGNATPPSRMVDGTNFLPVLTSTSTQYRPIPIAGYKMGTTRERRLYHGVVLGSVTYFRGQDGREEMYDVEGDPYQMRNLALDPSHRDQLRAMRRLADRLGTCSGDSCPKTYADTPDAFLPPPSTRGRAGGRNAG